jgi:hypothetical protein
LFLAGRFGLAKGGAPCSKRTVYFNGRHVAEAEAWASIFESALASSEILMKPMPMMPMRMIAVPFFRVIGVGRLAEVEEALRRARRLLVLSAGRC